MPLSLATYNIENGIYLGNILENLKSIANRNVNIICLQEVRELPNRQSVSSGIKQVLGKSWECHFLQDHADPVNGLGLGMCWNKNSLKLQEIKDILLPKLRYNYFEKLVNPGGKPSQRGAITATFKIADQKIRITTLHLDWQGGVEQRFQQITKLINGLKPFLGSEIVCGDFNTVDNKKRLGKSYTKLNKAIGLNYSEVFDDGVYTQINGTTEDPTYPYLYLIQKTLKLFNIKLYQRLDYIWYKGTKVIKSEIINCFGSDHLPLFAEFKIPENPGAMSRSWHHEVG